MDGSGNLVAQGFTPQQIIDYLAQIITAATRHDNVLYDIRWRLGYSEELSGDSVDNIMLKAVFSVQKLLPQAIGHFRETENAQSIQKLIRENREYQEQLIAAQPWGWETDACYEVLCTTEAWQELTHNPRRLAEWLLNHFTSPSPRTRAWVIDAIKQARGGFDGMTLPAKKLGYGSLNIIDALVDAGATWDNPDGPTTLYGALWTRWCRELDEIEGDLPAIAADPHLRRSVSNALDVMHIIDRSELFLRYKAAGELAAVALDRFADHRRDTTQNLGAVDWYYEKKILSLTNSQCRQLNPEAIDRIMDFDPVTELINTISYQTNQTHYRTDHVPSRQEAADLLALDNLDHLDPTMALIVANIHETHNWFTKLNQEIRGTTPTIGTLTDPAARYLYELEQTRGNPTAKSIINQITDLANRLAHPQQFAQSPKSRHLREPLGPRHRPRTNPHRPARQATHQPRISSRNPRLPHRRHPRGCLRQWLVLPHRNPRNRRTSTPRRMAPWCLGFGIPLCLTPPYHPHARPPRPHQPRRPPPC